MEQIFVAVGQCPAHDCTYVYTFTNPDAAIDFVALAKQHDDDAVTRWDIITERPRTALEAYAAHRAWVEGDE